MVKVTFVHPDGSERTLDLAVGDVLMKSALRNDIEGIVAECGGACACATCQVVVPPEWRGVLPAAQPMEQSMLDEDAAGRRLSCQIEVTAAMEGLVLHVPSTQH